MQVMLCMENYMILIVFQISQEIVISFLMKPNRVANKYAMTSCANFILSSELVIVMIYE